MSYILGYDVDGRPLKAGDQVILVPRADIYPFGTAYSGEQVTIIRIEPKKENWHPVDDPCVEFKRGNGELLCTGVQRMRKIISDHLPASESFGDLMNKLNGLEVVK